MPGDETSSGRSLAGRIGRLSLTARLWIGFGLFLVIYAALAWGWYPAFLGAQTAGPYWLMVFLAQSAFKLVGILVGGIPLIFMLRGLLWLIRGLRGPAMLWQPVIASFAAGVLLFPAGFPLFQQPIDPIQTLQAHGQTIQLAAIENLNATDYVLYPCDASGQWCRQVFYSQHTALSTAHLVIDPASGDAVVMICLPGNGGPDCQPAFTYHP